MFDQTVPGGGAYFCQHCRISVNGPAPWNQHIQSAKHLKKASQGVGAGRASPGPAAYSVPPTYSCSGRTGSPDLLSVRPAPAAEPLSPAGGFYCKPCGIRCSGPENWQQHVESARHIKITAQAAAAQDAFNTSPRGDRVDGVVTDSVPPPALPSTGDPFYCGVCNLSCTGPEPWRQHIESARHLKKAELAARAGGREAESSLEDVLSVASSRVASPTPSSLSGSEPDVVRRAFWPAPGALPVKPSGSAAGATYFCSPCQLSCSGAVPYRQHLDSAKHLKKALEVKGVSADSAPDTAAAGFPPLDVSVIAGAPSPSPGAVRAPAGGATYFCSVCQLSCSGPAPYRQHLDSAKHLKKVAVHNRYAAGSSCGSPGTSTPAGSSRGSSPDIFHPLSPPPAPVRETSCSAALPSPASPVGSPPNACNGGGSVIKADSAVDANCTDQQQSKRKKLMSTPDRNLMSSPERQDLMSSPERSDIGWSPSVSPSRGAGGAPAESVLDQTSCSSSLHGAGSPSSVGSDRSARQGASFLGMSADDSITSSPRTSRKRSSSPSVVLSETSSSDTDLIALNTTSTYPSDSSLTVPGKTAVANMYIEAKNDPVIASLTTRPPAPALDLNHTLFSRRRMKMTDDQVVQGCYAIRVGYRQFEKIDREDGISLFTANSVGAVLKNLTMEGPGGLPAGYALDCGS